MPARDDGRPMAGGCVGPVLPELAVCVRRIVVVECGPLLGSRAETVRHQVEGPPVDDVVTVADGLGVGGLRLRITAFRLQRYALVDIKLDQVVLGGAPDDAPALGRGQWQVGQDCFQLVDGELVSVNAAFPDKIVAGRGGQFLDDGHAAELLSEIAISVGTEETGLGNGVAPCFFRVPGDAFQ